MLLPPNQGLRVRGVASSIDWAAALAAFDPGSARLLKSEPGRCVWLAAVGGADGSGVRQVVLKCRALSPMGRARAWVGLSSLDREYRGAAALHAAQVPVAAPLALARGRREGAHVQCLVVAALEGRTLLALLADPATGVKRRLSLARAAGELVARTTRAGFVNRDPKPSNIIATTLHPPSLAFIDADPRRGGDPARMLAALVIEPTGCGLAPSRTVMLACVEAYVRAMAPGLDRGARRESVRALWGLAARRVRRHGDPRPRVMPLPPIAGDRS